MNRSLSLLSFPHTPTNDPASPARVRLMRDRWARMVHQLAAPEVEMTIEEVAPMMALFAEMRRAGVYFDPALIVLMDKLRVQCFWTEDDNNMNGPG